MQFERPRDAAHIGEGGYKKVYRSNSENPDRVWAESKHEYTPAQAKSIYYLNNIAHLLFPTHTVKIHQSGVTEDGSAYIASKYVSTQADSAHQTIQEEMLKGNGEMQDKLEIFNERAAVVDSSDDIKRFIDKLETAGLRENFAAVHALGPQDVIFDADGGFRFVDIDPAWEEPEDIGEAGYTENCLRFDPIKLQAAIQELEEGKQKQAQVYLDRLLELCRSVGFEV